VTVIDAVLSDHGIKKIMAARPNRHGGSWGLGGWLN